MIASNLILSEIRTDIKIIGQAYNVASGIQLVNKKKPDILFLDVLMPDGTGFELLEKIDYHQFAIVFVSAHNEYAQLAIDFEAMAYLNKPIKTQSLSGAIERAQKRLEYRNHLQQLADLSEAIDNFHMRKLPTRLAISNRSGIHYLPIDKIVYLNRSKEKVKEGYTILHEDSGRSIGVYANLKAFAKRLKPYNNFMRVHRSFIINLTFVISYDHEGIVELSNGKKVPVSQQHQEELKLRMAAI